jgi:hypothetical protein
LLWFANGVLRSLKGFFPGKKNVDSFRSQSVNSFQVGDFRATDKFVQFFSVTIFITTLNPQEIKKEIRQNIVNKYIT